MTTGILTLLLHRLFQIEIIEVLENQLNYTPTFIQILRLGIPSTLPAELTANI